MMTAPQTALITGASGGIGLEFVRICAREGYNMILVARSTEKLQQLKTTIEPGQKLAVTVLPADLADPTAPAMLAQQVAEAGITVDVLINNAGFAGYGLFVEQDIQQQLAMMQVNMLALTHLTHLFLPGMLHRKAGNILNVASTAAFVPGPLMAVYYATKAYVLSFSEALANEVKGSGVSVTALCPGPTASGFQARAAMEESRLIQSGLMDAETVAKIGFQGMLAGKSLVVPGFNNQITTMVPRFLPRSMVPGIVRNMQERTGH